MKNKQDLLKLKSENTEFASSICFELLFPELIKEQINQGAKFIVNVNDLSWFSNHLINDLFLAVAKIKSLRAQKRINT